MLEMEKRRLAAEQMLNRTREFERTPPPSPINIYFSPPDLAHARRPFLAEARLDRRG